jgi:hypothetical protein
MGDAIADDFRVEKAFDSLGDMALCRQGEECNRRLPGLQISLQELLNKCN